MKKTILLLFFLAASFMAKAQAVPSSCTAHDSIILKYKADAQRLTLRKIYRQNLPFKDSVIIPKSHSDTVLKAMVAVYNASSLAARDTVVDLLNIHSFPNPEINNFYVAADSGLTWMKQLKQNNLVTGNAAVDHLINKYHLKIDSYYSMSNAFLYQMVVFKADSSYNIKPLAKQFQVIPGVFYAEADGFFGDGNDIQDSIYTTHVELVYSFGWGDCPAGCINRRFWKFKVYPNCSVEFAGSYGNKWRITGMHQNEPEFLSVYPNPFTDLILIKGITKPFEYTIYNLLGQELRSGHTTNNKIENLNALNSGIYLLTLKSGNRQLSFKIFK